MKKIAAFFTALALLLAMMVSVHVFLSGDLNMNNKSFGTWFNMYKDMSYEAIASNIHEDTMLIFGSSEFGHGRNTIYHPKNLFKHKKIAVMTVGEAFNQCLSHAITLGAVENKIQNKKVVLFLSPSWFYKSGVGPSKYSLRFSECDYMAFMENKNIPESVKQYVANRSEKLLRKNPSQYKVARLTDKIYVDNSGNAIDKMVYMAKKTYATDRDILTVKSALKTSGIHKNKTYVNYAGNSEPINWDALAAKAAESASKKTNNQFFIRDQSWNSKFKKRYKTSKGMHKHEDMKQSPEYSDLECFLRVCKAGDLKPMLVILPMNGRWYDYTGLTAGARETFAKKVKKYGKEYNAEVADFTKYDYKPYIMMDAAHLWGEGWVRVDEKVYEFYNEI